MCLPALTIIKVQIDHYCLQLLFIGTIAVTSVKATRTFVQPLWLS